MEINKYVGERIKELRQKKNVTQQELGEYLNTTSQTISRYENGILEPNHNVLYKLADFFSVSINQFFPEIKFNNAEFVGLDTNVIKIPVYGTIKAGIPIESQADIIEYVDIPKEWTDSGKNFYGLKISGDSMFPKYLENDIVIFEQCEDIEKYNNKDVAVMINNTESTFKKILVNDQGIILQPYNTAYDIMMFSKEQVEQLPIRVVGVAREKRTKIV